MIVRINDRGPFAANRIMDVSRKTAEALDFRQRGTTRVKIEYIGAASLAGSNDEKLLATLRTDGPASIDGWAGRDRTMVAGKEASLMTPAEAETKALPSDGDTGASDAVPTGRYAGRAAPLPPARPFDLGTIRGAGVPIALR